MASKYWIKLYHEILDDPKMGRMPDRLWRRTIELFLLAGELDQDGALPEVKDMAWRLRINDDSLIDDLTYLINYGIVHKQGERFTVSKFAERQAPISDAERMRRLRERQQKEQYYGDEPVTNSVTNRKTDTDTDKNRLDTESEKKYALKEVTDQEAGFIDLFFDITGIERLISTGTYANWVQQVGEWVDMKVTEDEVKRAVEIAQKKNLTIVRPGSLTGIIRIERSNPPRTPRTPAELAAHNQAVLDQLAEEY